MAKHGGFPGGMPGNMNNLMKQAQRMQQKMQENQKALEEKHFEAEVGGGAVKITMTGKREVESLVISKEAVDPDDVETLQDLIVASFNECMKKIDDEMASQVNSITGGLGGGLF
jgi:DNA-binding YbaB/EbfC family protein